MPSKGFACNEYGAVRLSGVGTLSRHGRARFPSTPKTAEILRKGADLYLSVTFNVKVARPTRKSGNESTSFDWSIQTVLTQVIGDSLNGEVETVENPRWLKKQLERTAGLQQGIAREEDKAKKKSGKERGFPVNFVLRRLYTRLRNVHGLIARQRKDFYHKLNTAMVKRFGLIVTEELSTNNKSRAPAPRPNEDGTFAPSGAAARPDSTAASWMPRQQVCSKNFDTKRKKLGRNS
jgi:putative transposase